MIGQNSGKSSQIQFAVPLLTIMCVNAEDKFVYTEDSYSGEIGVWLTRHWLTLTAGQINLCWLKVTATLGCNQ